MEEGWLSVLPQVMFVFMCGCLFMVVVPIAAYTLWMLMHRERATVASVMYASGRTTLPAVS